MVQKAKNLLQKVTARKKSLLTVQSTALLHGEVNDVANQFEDLKVSQRETLFFVFYKIRNKNARLILSWWKSLLYRKQRINLLCKSMAWLLYDRDLRHKRINLRDSMLNVFKVNKKTSE